MSHEHFLSQLVEPLKSVRGICAIALGGSYASGHQRPDSDLDLGLYYRKTQPLDVEQIRAIAISLNDTPDPVVMPPGGWGTWVNGGAWLAIQGQRVDFLYRDLDFVSSTIDDCNNGLIRSDYWQQPAYGFHSFMYCAETAINQPLHDPEQLISALKTKVACYSPQLKQAIVKNFLWSARFTLDNLHKPAARGEVYMVVGGLARAIHCLVQVLYALNETYYLSEKRLALDVGTFNFRPDNFLERVNIVLGTPGMNNAQLQNSLEQAELLYLESSALSQAISRK